jgi:RNA recognition motif-containing protein
MYVGNISHSASEETLRELFEKIGPVVSVKIITDKFTGMPRGFGFVQMETTEDAQKAISELNGYELEGRKLVVNEAREKEEGARPRTGGYNNNRGGFSSNRGGGSRDRY